METDFLFVRPSFVSGLARTLDFWGVLNAYNWSRTGEEADARATWLDWVQVSHDLDAAMVTFRKTYDKQLSLFEAAGQRETVLVSSENEQAP